MISSSYEWKSKVLAVAQSHKAGRQAQKETLFLLPMSLCKSPAEGVSQIKGVGFALSQVTFELRDLLALSSLSCLKWIHSHFASRSPYQDPG